MLKPPNLHRSNKYSLQLELNLWPSPERFTLEVLPQGFPWSEIPNINIACSWIHAVIEVPPLVHPHLQSDLKKSRNKQIEWLPPPLLQHSCWQFLQLLQGRCRVTCLWKFRHSLQAMQLRTTLPEDVTNMRAWDDLKGATTLPNSEAHFQVLTAPDVHPLVVGPNLI